MNPAAGKKTKSRLTYAWEKRRALVRREWIEICLMFAVIIVFYGFAILSVMIANGVL